MRGDRSVPRGEAGRVALRVRQLLGDDEDEYDDLGPDGSGPDGIDPDELGDAYGDGAPTRWQRLRARVPVRIDPGRRAAWGVGVAVVLAAIVTGLWLMSSRPTPVPVAARVPQVPGSVVTGSGEPRSSVAAGSASPTDGSVIASSPSPSPSGVVVVDVAGKVRRPGLYRLPSGSRVDDAVNAAGGARPGVDLTGLNLAALLADGQQIVVGAPAGAQGPVTGGASGAASGAAGSSTTGPVDLNTATLEQLDGLPGIGPALAQRILDWRAQHGRFGTVDELNDVSGIGDVKFAELKSLVTV